MGAIGTTADVITRSWVDMVNLEHGCSMIQYEALFRGGGWDR
jgi:hypothetical protein